MADIILVFILALFAFDGWKRGFIKTLLSLSSTVVSFAFGMVLYNPISKIIGESSLGDVIRENVYKFLTESGEQLLKTDVAIETANTIVINTVSFILVIILTKIFITILSKVLNITAKLPVIKQANKVLGMAVGLISGLVVCYIAAGVIKNLSASDTVLQIIKSIESSSFAIKFYNNNIISDVLAKFMK